MTKGPIRTPKRVVEANDRNDLKPMIFIAITNGETPPVYYFGDKDGRSVTLNDASYLSVFDDFFLRKKTPNICSGPAAVLDAKWNIST